MSETKPEMQMLVIHTPLEDVVEALKRQIGPAKVVTVDMTEIERRVLASLCHDCNGTGAVDSGGVTPWMAPIDVKCGRCDGTGTSRQIRRTP